MATIQVHQAPPAENQTTGVIAVVQEKKYLGNTPSKAQYIKSSFMDFVWLYGTHVLLNPFDRLKTIKQCTTSLTAQNLQVEHSNYANLVNLVKSERFRGFFKGTNASFLSTLIKISVQMQFYQSFRNYYFSEGEFMYSGADYWLRRVVGATLAALMTTALVYPFEVSRTHMYVEMHIKGIKPTYRSVFGSLSEIKRFHGWPGMYRGCVGSLATVPVQILATMGVYEGVLSLKARGVALPFPLDNVPLPYITAAIASVVCHPLDTIRRNWMITTFGMNTKSSKINPVRISLSKFKSKKGFCNPMDGFVPCLLRAAAMLGLVSVKNSEVYKQVERLD